MNLPLLTPLCLLVAHIRIVADSAGAVAPPMATGTPSVWPGILIGLLTLGVLVGQLLVFRRQAKIMESQANAAANQTKLMEAQSELLKSQHDLAHLQVEWRRDEALATLYRIAFDLVEEFKKANVLPMVAVQADFATHPRQSLREAGKRFASLGHDVVRLATQTAMRLDEYFASVKEYNARPSGRGGADRLLAVQSFRDAVGSDLDLANRAISPEIRWTYGDGHD